MDEVNIIDVNDTTEYSFPGDGRAENVVVLISSEGEDQKSPTHNNFQHSLAKSLEDATGPHTVDDEDVVLLENNVSVSFSFEVDGKFQNDTAIESEEDILSQPQTQSYKRSQSRLLDEIEYSGLSSPIFSGEDDNQAVISTVPPVVSRNLTSMGASHGYTRAAPQSSPSERFSQVSNYYLASSPTSSKSTSFKSTNPASYPAQSPTETKCNKRPFHELQPPKFATYQTSNSKGSQRKGLSDAVSVALDLTEYMEQCHDSYGTLTSDTHIRHQASLETKTNSYYSRSNSLHDSIVVGSDDENGISDTSPLPKEKPLFVQHSSQSTPVNSKRLMLRQPGHMEDEKVEEMKPIVNSRPFTDQDYLQMVKKSLGTPAMKKLYNECNKVTRTEENIYNEMILTINTKVMELMQSKHISFEEELKPLTIIHNYDEYPIIRFKRRCTSVYDQTHGIFYPCDEVIADESICVLVYEALPFFHRYRTDKKGLWDEIRQFSKHGMKVIVVIYGLNSLRKKLCNMENKQHENRVLEQLPGSAFSQSQSKTKRKSTQETKMRELNMKSKNLERILNEVTIYANVDVFPIENLNEFSHWMKNLVWVVGKMRYDVTVKYKEWSHLNVKSGKSPTDVLFNFLQQIAHVNEPKAKRVVTHYKSFQSLMSDMNAGYVAQGNDNKPLMLKSLERALHTLYTSDDPNELIFTD
ncbi:unnamed protein product [Kluyveromyces dobzhanskii CBS 2104]|uniref:WGS project CCBQ000000000 data, contig 00014 n=1 Tax=Kluyveromyces dobzhanskii CBS 2104 TaxID=1427455 RepID=A0A0A8L9A9_9SACH|nr:unnamed protein product [Kluyveromyces dobzhanskii CBS 2104]